MSTITITSGSLAAPALADSPDDAVFVAPGDEIHVDHEAGFLKGHGTLLVDGVLRATTCGTVQRVNKLVAVRPLKSRYTAETGDVVVGRVTEVAGKRWKLDINARQEALLMLSAVTLPGGVQRRRTSVDELNMRSLFEEDDLVSAEVQSFFSDGGVALHTRSAKYGRLGRGQLVCVPPALIRRLKQHFCALPAHGVELILGCNGWVWVQAQRPAAATDGAAGPAAGDARPDEAPGAWDEDEALATPVEAEARERICRIAAAVHVLAALYRPVHPASLAAVADAALALGVPPRGMLLPGFLEQVAQTSSELLAEEPMDA